MMRYVCDACGQEITDQQERVSLDVRTSPRKFKPKDTTVEELLAANQHTLSLPTLDLDLHLVCFQSRFEQGLLAGLDG